MPLDALSLRRASRHLRRADPVLGEIVARVGPCRLRPHRGLPPFAYLARAILRQQISGHAANAIDERLHARFGEVLHPDHVIGATDQELRTIGLSRQKISYMRDLASKSQDGLPLHRIHRMGDERIIETLSTVRGIGRWTAEMYLMFRLGRPDVLPVDDYGIRKAMQLAYRMLALPKPDRMRKIAESWRPYRTVACWYLWRSLD